MPEAEEVAAAIAYELFREGRFAQSTGPIEVPGLIAAAGVTPAYVKREVHGFGAISVQAVGFEAGTDDPAVHIYLTHGTMRQMRSLPQKIDGVPVRTHKVGAINVRPEAAGSATNAGHIFERDGRLCCGSSCAPTSEATAGTLGALCRLSGSAGLYLLSNNHVFAGCNHVPKGQPILAPANMDGRPHARAPGEIGRHHQIEPLRSGHPALVEPCTADLALAVATDADTLSSWQGDERTGFDTPRATAEPLSMTKVKKFGRTTGLTTGRVEAKILAPMPVTYNSKSFKGTVWFKNVWSVLGDSGPFALQGDSGSLVATDDGSTAVGVIFAASNSGDYAFMVPMDHILTTFAGLRLVHGHGV